MQIAISEANEVAATKQLNLTLDAREGKKRSEEKRIVPKMNRQIHLLRFSFVRELIVRSIKHSHY